MHLANHVGVILKLYPLTYGSGYLCGSKALKYYIIGSMKYLMNYVRHGTGWVILIEMNSTGEIVMIAVIVNSYFTYLSLGGSSNDNVT